MSLGLSAGVHRVMAAHSTHQAFKGSGKTAQMTAGFAPHRETANLPARRFGRPPESAHPIFRDNPSYWNFKRQSRARKGVAIQGPQGAPRLLDCFASLAMTIRGSPQLQFYSSQPGPSKDLDGFPLDLLSQSRMQAIARRQIDMRVEASLQDRLDVDQVERVELVRPLSFDEDIDVAIVA